MVSRTAFVQLNYSILTLFIAMLGMLIVYTIPFIGILIGLIIPNALLFSLGMIGWLAMFFAYIPTIRLYNRPIWEASLLSISALLYAMMTTMSAYQYILGSKPTWKGRPMNKEIKNASVKVAIDSVKKVITTINVCIDSE